MQKVLSGLVLFFLAACASEPPAPLGPAVVVPSGPGLSASEIRNQLVGNTGTGPMSGSLANFSVYLAPDGSAIAKLPSGVDQGRWRVSQDDQLCMVWERYRNGQEFCQRVYRDGDVYRLVNNNSVEVLRFQAGKTI